MNKFKILSLAIIAIAMCSCGDKNTIKLSPDSSMAFSPISNYVELNGKSKVLLVREEVESGAFDVTLNVTLDVKQQGEVISPDVTFVILDGKKAILDKFAFKLGTWNSPNVCALRDSIENGHGQLSLKLSTKDEGVAPKMTEEDWKTIKSKGKYVMILNSSFSTYNKAIDSQIQSFATDIDKYVANMDAKNVDQFSIYYRSYEQLCASAKRVEEARPRMAKRQLAAYEEEMKRLVDAAKKLQ